MSKVDDLKAEELNRLNNNDDEIFDLESLITDGADARFPIIVKFPKGNETVEAAAMIRPLTSIELNNLSRTSRGSNVSNFGVELLSTDEARQAIAAIMSKANEKLQGTKTANAASTQPKQKNANTEQLSARDVKKIAEDMRAAVVGMQELIAKWEQMQFVGAQQRGARAA